MGGQSTLGRADGAPRDEVRAARDRLRLGAVGDSERGGTGDRTDGEVSPDALGRDVQLARGQKVSLGDDLFSFISPHNQPGVRESLERAFAGEAHTHRTEARGRHFETVYSPVREAGGEVVAVSIRVADVTAR